MAYPAGIITRPVTFGPAFELEDGDIAGMTVAFKATRPGVLWMATGSPAVSVAITRNADDGVEQTVYLPVTDQAGWGDGDGNAIDPGEDGNVFLYSVTVVFTQGGRTLAGAQPRTKTIAIPQGDGSPLDLDKLIPLTSPGGTVVSVPDIWSGQIEAAAASAAAAEAAVLDSAAFVGSEIARAGSPANVELTAKIAPVVADGLVAERTVNDNKYAPVGASLVQAPGKNLYDKNVDYGPNTCWTGNPAPVTLNGYYASAKIPVTVGSQYTVNNAANVKLLKSDGSNARFIDNPSAAPVTVTIAANETHIAFTVATAKRDAAQLELGTIVTSYEPYGVKVQRLLGGGRLLDDALADSAAVGTAALKAASLTVHKTGTDLLVRSAFDDTRDILMPVALAGTLAAGGEPMVSFATTARQNVQLVPNTAKAAEVWPTVAATITATSIHAAADDNCPLNVQGAYVGANHGWPGACKITMTGHGKTNADRGSTWTDGTNPPYTLLQVIDANTLLMGYGYFVSAGVVTPASSAPAAALTHVAGATSTGTIAISGGVAATQIHPSTHSRTYTALLDGRPLVDGTAAGQVLSIVETYKIVSFKGLIDWSRANIGADPFANLPAMVQLARVSNTYRFTQAQVVVGQTVTLLDEPLSALGMGVTQAFPVTVPSGGTLRQFMPGLDTITDGTNTFDMKTLATLGTLAGQVNVTASKQLNPSDPPNRSIQWAYDSAAAKAWGLMVAILPVMDGKAATRRANGSDTRSWYLAQSTKKNYPQLAWAKALPAGGSLSGVAVRRYLPPSATPEQVLSDGSRHWVTIDRPDANTTQQIAKVPSVLGRKLNVIGAATVTPARSFVDGEGVTYTNPAPGYLMAEAVVDTSV